MNIRLQLVHQLIESGRIEARAHREAVRPGEKSLPGRLPAASQSLAKQCVDDLLEGESFTTPTLLDQDGDIVIAIVDVVRIIWTRGRAGDASSLALR